MPALVAFNRRWQVGSDDLVFVFGGGLLARLFWLAILCIILGVYHDDMKSCNASSTLQAFFIATIIINCLVIINEFIIIRISMRGTIINTRPRRHIPYFLYIQLFLYLPEICISGLGIYWAFYDSTGCKLGLTIPVQVTVVFQWCILLIAILVVLIFFDPLGSSQAGLHDENNVHIDQTTKLWEKRCRLLCCCFVGKDEDYMNAISDIAKVFAYELHGVDAVPSDVAVGLILLQQQQENETRKLIESGKAPVLGVPVVLTDPDEKSIIQDAAHFVKYSLGSYGWPMYMFMNPCCGALSLFSKIRCCSGCTNENNVPGDNCCMCNTAAVRLQSDISEEDLYYISFHNKLYEIPFYVALDDESKAVIISIRGTLSMRDAMTDLTGHGEKIDMHVDGLQEGSMAHKGMFLTAQYIKDQLIDKRILQGAFEEAQRRGHGEYRLVVVGHSLGAGTASVLSMLLKPLYPELQCFAYSNPSCLNDIATAQAQDYVTSIILGNDVVPRMGVKNLNTLKRELETVILNCNLPKYRILMTGFWRALCFFLGKDTTKKDFFTNNLDEISHSTLMEPLLGEREPLNSVDCGGSYLADEQNGEETRTQNRDNLVQLYPAGKILQIYEKTKNRPRSDPRYEILWANKEIYYRVLISPRMVTDHLPDAVMAVLENISKMS